MDQGQGKGKGRIDFDIQPIDETTESFRNFVRRYRNSPATQKSYTG
jgi:hypothetical protein